MWFNACYKLTVVTSEPTEKTRTVFFFVVCGTATLLAAAISRHLIRLGNSKSSSIRRQFDASQKKKLVNFFYYPIVKSFWPLRVIWLLVRSSFGVYISISNLLKSLIFFINKYFVSKKSRYCFVPTTNSKHVPKRINNW